MKGNMTWMHMKSLIPIRIRIAERELFTCQKQTHKNSQTEYLYGLNKCLCAWIGRWRRAVLPPMHAERICQNSTIKNL